MSTDTPGDPRQSDTFRADTDSARTPPTNGPTSTGVGTSSAPGEALRTTESRLRRAVASGHVGLWEWNLRTNSVYYSPEWKRQIGYEPHEISDSFDEWRDRLHPDDRERAVARVDEYVRDPAGLFLLEFRFRHKDGSYRWILAQASVECDGSGRAAFMLGAHVDITERTQAEEELRQRSALQGLSADILATLNEPLSLGEATRRILNAIKRVTGVDAAGIRLRQGFDFPYAAADGFSPAFLDSENSLLPRGPDRGFCTEADGSPRLACSCGLVVGGKARELGLPMSEGGSVWANDALSFLDAPPEDDPRLSPRNLCIHEGYQSVALVPIRLRGDIVGLLQLNDRRPNRFTLDTIRFFDGIAASFAVALSRRRDEEKLQASESNLQSLFDAIPESVILMDGDGTLLAANETFARRFGKTAAECVGRGAFELVSGEVSERRKQVFADVMRSGRPAVFEDQRDGRWLQLHLYPVTGPDGAARRLVVFGVDITERRRMQEEIRVERELLRLAMRAGRAAASEWDIEHDRVFWTAEMFPLWGLEPIPNPVPADLWQSRIHPDDRDRVAAALEEALRAGTFAQDMRVVWPDGSVRWLSVRSTVHYDPAGRPVRMVGITQDITDRRTMEAALAETNDRYRHLLETSTDWIWEVDQEGRYTFASHQVHDLLGLDPADVLGRTPFDLMPPDEARRVAALFEATAASRRPLVGLENTLRHSDGSLVVVETTGVPVFGPNGEYRGYRGMDRNVSERKRLEEQLRQAQKLEAIGQLAGGVAHDFNNILAATMMHLGLMQANPNLDEDTQAGLQELEHETERAASLTRQLLMFSRRSLMDVRRLDLNELASNLLKMLRRLIGEHIDLRFDARGPAIVDGDAGMLEQVLVNLVVNARDSMPGGGRISIATEVVTAPGAGRPPGEGTPEGRFVCLSVTDTGSGMDRRTLERIFEPFFTTKEAGKGTGLGLAVAHGIVGQHRGWIVVESEVGRGSTFRLFLPEGPGRPEETAQSRERKPVRGGKETVLLVEDDKALRRLVTKLLTSLGYRVLEADNGQQAMASWREHGAEIDLLFTDMVMPEGMTGRELYERLQVERPGLRTIISSGYSSEPIQATRKGMLYLPKPYNMATLADVVRRCLDRS